MPALAQAAAKPFLIALNRLTFAIGKEPFAGR
jgi:hypothetical protein